MSLHYDEKGKFFTDYVSKDSVSTILQTTTHRIQGYVYLRTDERVSDMLNRSDEFLAVTDAVIFAPDGSELFQCPFLAVSRNHIIWLMPEEKNPDPVADTGGAS
jgi:hypothetical protein